MNTTTLTLINLQSEDAGNYRCVATNASGSSSSDYANLLIKGIAYIYVAIMYFATHILNLKSRLIVLGKYNLRASYIRIFM